MTISVVALAATVLAVAVFALRRLRPAGSSGKDMGIVSQSWLMENRADSQRDRFS